MTSITVLSGGVGAARFLQGALRAVPSERVTAVVNVGDDVDLHGLHVSPDLDTVTYTLAGAINPTTGWGLRDETWNAMDSLGRYGGPTWFRLGDRDLGTHLYRTHRLRNGAHLSEVTAEIAQAWGLTCHILPASDDRLETRITLDEGEVGFQDYFVGRRHAVPVRSVRFSGADAARPAPGVVDAIESADVVVIAPSNPLVSIAPIRAVADIDAALRRRRDRVVAVSPIVGGRALKGPASDMLRDLGHDPSVVGVASLYRPIAAALVIDPADAPHAGAIHDQEMAAVVTPTVMTSIDIATDLARAVIRAGLGDRP